MHLSTNLSTYDDFIRREDLVFGPGEKWLVDDPSSVRVIDYSYSPSSYYEETLVMYRKDIEYFNKVSRVLGVIFILLLGGLCISLL